MNFERLERHFSAKVLEKHGHRVSITISGDHTDYPLWQITESSDPGPSHFTDKKTCILKEDSRDAWSLREVASMSEEDQLSLMLANYESHLQKDALLHEAIAIAIQNANEQDLAILSDLRIRKNWGWTSKGERFTLQISWTGHGDDLTIATQYREEYFYGPGTFKDRPLEDDILKLIRAAAQKARLTQKAAQRGYTLDLPLQAFLAEVGKTHEHFIEAVLAHGFSKSARKWEDQPGPMLYEERKISVSIINGHVTGKIAITDKIAWSKGCLTARGFDFPTSTLTGLSGRPLREVIDHPWLDGLIVTNATVSKSDKGGSCATFMTKAA